MPLFNKKKEENNKDNESYAKESELKLEPKEESPLEILKEPKIIEKEEEEKEEGIGPQKPEEAFKKTSAIQIPSVPSATMVSEKPIKIETQQTIERILSEDLEDIFLNLPPEKQKRIEEKKEEISLKIEKIISEVKVKISKIFSLIKNWLKLIPGVNKFFLEQETKIKMDKILELSKNLKPKT